MLPGRKGSAIFAWCIPGNPLEFHLSRRGKACDLQRADGLLPQLDTDLPLADKGFDADQRVLTPWQRAGKGAVIPPKANRKGQREYDKELYKARHPIENFFAKLKLFRAIPHDTTRLPVTSSLPSISPLFSSG
jgi:transposase